ncbi:MAG: cytochrome P450 [Actinomycetota bacterium]|nr:cytochrome P450 [Actinomycetota bacterium]
MTTEDVQATLRRYDNYDDEFVEPMYDLLAAARRECPVFRTEADPGYWVVSKFADAKAVLLNPAVFSSTDGNVVHGVGDLAPLPTATDPPLHRDYRELMKPFFTRSAILEHEEALRAIADELIDSWIDDGTVEFVSQFAAPFAFRAFAEIFLQSDDPTSIDTFMAAADRIVAESTPEAFMEVGMLVFALFEHRRATASETGDLIDALEVGTVDGRPLNDVEKVSTVMTAVGAGFETNLSSMAIIMALVAEDPELEARIIGPDWAERHLDEFLRYQSPVVGLARTLAEDTELHGAHLAKGDKVVVHFASADRDEERFPDAERLDFDRKNSAQHLAFGGGVHRCIGAPMAEIVVGIGLDQVTKRATGFRLANGGPVRYTAGLVRRPADLHLSFVKR